VGTARACGLPALDELQQVFSSCTYASLITFSPVQFHAQNIPVKSDLALQIRYGQAYRTQSGGRGEF
jgi:hypothetical protein